MAKYGLQLVTGPAAEPVSLAEALNHCREPPSVDYGRIQSLIIAARRLCEVQTCRQIVAATWRVTWDGFYNQNLLPRPGVMLSSLAGGLAGWADAWRAWQERGGGWGTAEISTIRLPGGQLQSVSSITYYDDNGDLQTLASSMYQVDNQQVPGRVVPSYGNVWPTTRSQLNAVAITYTVGWPHTQVSGNIAAGSQTVTPASMQGIQEGQVLWVQGQENTAEWITVGTVTSTTFTATFATSHTGPVTISAVPEELRQAILLLVSHWNEHREAADRGEMIAVPMAVESLLSGTWTGEM